MSNRFAVSEDVLSKYRLILIQDPIKFESAELDVTGCSGCSGSCHWACENDCQHSCSGDCGMTCIGGSRDNDGWA